jgi:hypothetical protein
MNNKLRNSLVVSAIAICGLVVGQAGVKAEPVTSSDIEFSGTISNMCTWGTPTAGVLADITSPTQTSLETSTPAQIKLSCNGDVVVDADLDSEDFAASNGNMELEDVELTSELLDNEGLLTGPIDNTYDVSAKLNFTGTVQPGTYTYKIKFTATPQ